MNGSTGRQRGRTIAAARKGADEGGGAARARHRATRRDTRGSETRAALLAAGRRLFARKGFDGASVRDITREAGTNLGAITYHFGSKRGLYDAVLADGFAPLVERLGQAADPPGEPVERLGRIIDVLFEYIGANPELPRLLLQEIAAGKQPPAAAVALLQKNAGHVVRILAEGWADGSIRPGHPILSTVSIVAQPIYMSIMAPLLREVGGVDLSDPATRKGAAEHVKAFVRTGLAVRREGLE